MGLSIVPSVPLVIDGERRTSSHNGMFEVHNPSTGDLLSIVASASSKDCSDAVEAAEKAFEAWSSATPARKAAVFAKVAEIFSSEGFTKKAIKTQCAETGATAAWAGMDVWFGSTLVQEGIQMVYEVKGSILPSDYGSQVFVQKRPMGVIFLICPWNAPIAVTVLSIVPAIAAGNTVVLKTSECSPATQLLVADAFQEAGLPSGVINVVHASREDTPARTAELIAHPSVRKIGFTGSDRVAKLIAIEAAKCLKPCIFELGGKAPVIVLNDADIESAAKFIVDGAMLHSGQGCIATERVIVTREVSESLIQHIVALTRKLRAGGDGQLGGLFCRAAAENVVGMIKDALEDGAQLLVGDLKADGVVVQPHVVLGTKPGSRLWDIESFGPVVTIAVAESVDEAVSLANASTYSLTSALWTKDMDLAFRISRRVRAGKVFVNGPTHAWEPRFAQAGLGGSSGYGRFSVDSFLDEQMISFRAPGERTLLFD